MSDYKYNIPEYTKQAIDDYVKKGIPTGDFLKAVLANDLMRSVGRADHNNRAALHEICSYVYNEIPSRCHGSYEIVNSWIDKFLFIKKSKKERTINE